MRTLAMRRIPSLYRVANGFRERLLSLVMVPAVLLGTLPHTACICADGHREEFCQAIVCRNTGTPRLETKNGGCCRAKASGSKTKNCCQTSNSHAHSGCQLGAATGSCCNPIVESPAPVVISGKAELAAKSLVVAAIEPPNLIWTSANAWPTLPLTVHSTPPPVDTVIVYLHLTI
jgi:hypothetical protein